MYSKESKNPMFDAPTEIDKPNAMKTPNMHSRMNRIFLLMYD